MRTKFIAAAIAAVICAGCTAAFPAQTQAAALRIIGDINGDGALNSPDMLLLQKYLLGTEKFTKDNASCADINGDGKINIFDMVDWREQYSYNGTHMPSGTWIGEGFDGTRLFWFGSNTRGRYTDAASGTSTGFTLKHTGSGLNFALDTSSSAKGVLSWIDDTHFTIKWDGMTSETFTYVSDKEYYSGPYLNGTFASSKGGVYHMSNYSGYTGQTRFTIIPMGTKAMFLYSDGTRKTGDFSRTDKNHFTLKWQDGSSENFTRREMSVINGVTYVNGILIANKSYSLPENYNPGGLTSDTQAAFTKMQNAAAKDGIKLWVCSGFRSYSYQAQLYNNYVARDGKAKADTYSARPGHSEHQTGMAIDVCYAASWFDNTPETIWLANHCHEYGFILRYPKGKENITGYIYESWHVRYVGMENAKLIHDSGLTLEEYLGIDSYYH